MARGQQSVTEPHTLRLGRFENTWIGDGDRRAASDAMAKTGVRFGSDAGVGEPPPGQLTMLAGWSLQELSVNSREAGNSSTSFVLSAGSPAVSFTTETRHAERRWQDGLHTKFEFVQGRLLSTRCCCGVEYYLAQARTVVLPLGCPFLTELEKYHASTMCLSLSYCR